MFRLKLQSWLAITTIAMVAFSVAGNKVEGQFTAYMPDESAPHEGTWLQWPHHFTYGFNYRNQIESSWVELTEVLIQSENVHIIVYNQNERNRIQNLLNANGVSQTNIDFTIRANDDFWVRDNGPIFVYDWFTDELKINDFGFNGWGFDTPFALDNTVPIGVANQHGFQRFDLNDLILEGGAIEVDGNGTLMATRSSILEPDRNPGWTEEEVEEYLSDMLGVTNFVWLDGAPGGQFDITDTHIDGFARFGLPNTIVTMNPDDLRYWGISNNDIRRLYYAQNANGHAYNRVFLPLTQNDVVTSYGFNLGYKGSYVNFYTSNGHVIVPTYNDPNDQVAIKILQRAFPKREVVGIDFRNAYRWGGMVHCVTQQQPIE